MDVFVGYCEEIKGYHLSDHKIPTKITKFLLKCLLKENKNEQTQQVLEQYVQVEMEPVFLHKRSSIDYNSLPQLKHFMLHKYFLFYKSSMK
jgi:hypothetical protein